MKKNYYRSISILCQQHFLLLIKRIGVETLIRKYTNNIPLKGKENVKEMDIVLFPSFCQQHFLILRGSACKGINKKGLVVPALAGVVVFITPPR